MNLPKDLEETFHRCMDRIIHHSRFALKALRWVHYAMRPLYIDELSEAVAFDLQNQTWSLNENLISCAILVILAATNQCVRSALYTHSSATQNLEDVTAMELSCILLIQNKVTSPVASSVFRSLLVRFRFLNCKTRSSTQPNSHSYLITPTSPSQKINMEFPS